MLSQLQLRSSINLLFLPTMAILEIFPACKLLTRKNRRRNDLKNNSNFLPITPESKTAQIKIFHQQPSCVEKVGQRIEQFELDYWNGNDWEKATEGTTVGYKRLLEFDPVSTDKVRLKILSSRLNPTLAELGLYKKEQ